MVSIHGTLTHRGIRRGRVQAWLCAIDGGLQDNRVPLPHARLRTLPSEGMQRSVGLTLEPEHFGTRAFLLDVNDVACLVDRSVGFLLLRLDLRELLVQTFELCFCFGDVGLEGFDLIAIGGVLNTL